MKMSITQGRIPHAWLFACALIASNHLFAASAPAPAALQGVISSAAEGKMEGVGVSAQKSGSPITVSVASDKQGRYQFPGDRLAAGDYAVRIRAVGYEPEKELTVKLRG